MLVSFPPLSNMLKFSGSSRLTSGRTANTLIATATKQADRRPLKSSSSPLLLVAVAANNNNSASTPHHTTPHHTTGSTLPPPCCQHARRDRSIWPAHLTTNQPASEWRMRASPHRFASGDERPPPPWPDSKKTHSQPEANRRPKSRQTDSQPETVTKRPLAS